MSSNKPPFPFRIFLSPQVVIGSLGYFVDVFDLVIFSVVRMSSLRGIGVAEANLLSEGTKLLNFQLIGLLLGGAFWGMVGDRKGRKAALYGSILLYSAANLANAFVTSVDQYAFCRLLAGFGLAGELGTALTLVGEALPQKYRGYGTTAIMVIGLLGAIFAGALGERMGWQAAFFAGGILGFLLLLLRFALPESQLYLASQGKAIKRGSLLMLVNSKDRARRFFACIFAGLPIWYVMGVVVTFTPEIGLARGIPGLSAGKAVLWSSLGITIGDLVCGLLSQWFGSRKKVILGALLAGVVILVWSLGTESSAEAWYFHCFLLAMTAGYGGVLCTMGVELFGTNLRSLVANSVPNIVRGSAVLSVLLFGYLKNPLGPLGSAFAVGIGTVGVALFALSFLEETFERDLDFME